MHFDVNKIFLNIIFKQLHFCNLSLNVAYFSIILASTKGNSLPFVKIFELQNLLSNCLFFGEPQTCIFKFFFIINCKKLFAVEMVESDKIIMIIVNLILINFKFLSEFSAK